MKDIYHDQLLKLVDSINATQQKQRAHAQMTVGSLIAVLERLDGGREVVGLGELDSYRGYYCDLAFEPDETPRTVENLLSECKAAIGRCFHGYKGGDYLMDDDTPLWVSALGEVSGMKLVGLDTDSDPIRPVTEEEIVEAFLEPPDGRGGAVDGTHAGTFA